jgi:arylsulfatase A-like enzyme
MDASVGEIMQVVKSFNSSTLVIFTSDNGILEHDEVWACVFVLTFKLMKMCVPPTHVFNELYPLSFYNLSLCLF